MIRRQQLYEHGKRKSQSPIQPPEDDGLAWLMNCGESLPARHNREIRFTKASEDLKMRIVNPPRNRRTTCLPGLEHGAIGFWKSGEEDRLPAKECPGNGWGAKASANLTRMGAGSTRCSCDRDPAPDDQSKKWMAEFNSAEGIDNQL